MKNSIKIILATGFMAFLVSFVASLPGLVIFAYITGNNDNPSIRRFSGSKKLLRLAFFLIMEIGFLGSALLHSGIIDSLNHLLSIAIALSLGLIFYIFGRYMKYYKRRKRYLLKQKILI